MSDAMDVETPKLLSPYPGCFVRQEVDNIGWVDMSDHVVVVDALEQAGLEAQVLEAIRSTCGGKPVRTVVNTHTHSDHTALNGAFRAHFGATIVNARTHPIPPAGLSWTCGARRLEVLGAPGCHTAEDVVVWLPRERLLFVGDIFGWGLIPWDRALDRPRLDHIVATYRRLADLEPAVVVPGHGPLGTAAELRRWVCYVEELVSQVRALCSDGTRRRDLDPSAVPPPADMRHWWRFLKWKHADAVAKVVQAVSRGRL